MIKYGLLLLLVMTGATARADESDLIQKYAPQGTLIIGRFESAPFPHPLRMEGHKYHDTLFSAADHYQNNQIVLFVPKDFHPESSTDFVVHFHGWSNNATNALGKYSLVDQFVASKRNAVLIVPQGPFNAPDSFDGKLEDAGGFGRFMAEAVATLKQRHLIKTDRIGKIILSGHSGGYEVISSIVAWGGINQNIREVWLFDALYGNTERFVTWFDHHKGRFIDVFTDHGGTLEEASNLMTALKENRVPFFRGDQGTVSMKALKDNHLVFLHSDLPHDHVMQDDRAFQRFLETSSLGSTP